MSQYEKSVSKDDAMEQFLRPQLFQILNSIRRYSLFFDYQELSPEDLLYLSMICTWRVCDSDYLKNKGANSAITQLFDKGDEYRGKELYFLQRINYRVKFIDPDWFQEEAIEAALAKYEPDLETHEKNKKSEMVRISTAFFRLVQCCTHVYK